MPSFPHLRVNRPSAVVPIFFTLLFLFSAFGAVGAPTAAAAEPLTCGSVVTTSVVLDRDLVDCPGDGLVIGAAGITVDLGNHTVDGTGTGAGVVNNGFDNVTIKNGTVQGFQVGVHLNAGTNGVVQKITIGGSNNGGLLLDGASGNRLENNTVDGSGDTAVHLTASSGNTLAGNTVTNSSDFAIWVEQGSNDNVLQGNTLGSSSTGIEVQDSDGNTLTGNTATSMGETGISLSNANNSVVKDNKVGSNPSGIRLHGSSGNRIEGNDASGSTSTGIELGDGSLKNELVGNVSNNNSARGIAVSLEAPAGSGNTIEANTASGNKDDGIHVAKGGHTIRGNTTKNNGKYGIWAGTGNTDGGGNVATGNGETVQCVGVVCTDGTTTPEPEPEPDPTDTTAPDTQYETGPVQDTASTVKFTFSGTDDVTASEHLTYECRLQETDSTYVTDPAIAYVGCASPWQVPLPEPGHQVLEIRAIDTAGNVDASPAKHTFEVPVDSTPPDTSFVEKPADPTTGTSATFAFTGDDPSPSNGSALDFTPAEFLSFECLLDGGAGSPDPTEAWLECASPHTFSNLAPGSHTVEVRAIDGAGNFDASPASYTWTMEDGTSTEPPPPPGEPTEADARTVACGDVITVSTWVGNDLTDCPGEGLVIGAPDITLNLGGHTIDGNLSVAPGEETGLPAGIRNGGHGNVTVKNGTVTGFGYGVRLLGPAAHNLVEGMTLTGNQVAGVELVDADNGSAGNTIKNNTLTDNGGGVALIQGSQNSVVSGNTMTGNAGHAVLIQDASGHTIADNTISGKRSDPLLGSDSGIYVSAATDNDITGNKVSETGDAAVLLTAGSNKNSVAGNTITQPGGSAISVQDSDGTQVLNNTATLTAGVAIDLGGNNSTVQGNDVRSNPGGIHLAGSDNTVDTNDVTGATGNGITVESGLGNRVTNNLANQTNGTGVAVNVEAVDTQGSPIPGNLIQGNTANENNGDGIKVARGGHTITGNTANNNAGYGIHAGEGVIDGGGNTASGNAKVEQCVNVVCDGSSTPPPSEPDTTAPETTIDSGPPSTTDSTTASFTFSANESNVGFECSLDGAVMNECESPTDYTGLATGSHTFAVVATDVAGNIDPTPATHTWEITSPAPTCSGSGAVTVGANADSWIHSKDSGKNFGTDSVLKVTTKSGENARALVRFKLPTVPADCEVTDVALRLFNASPKAGRSIQVLQLNGSWTEGGVTWSNQPATTGTAVTATTPSSSAWMQWSVTEQVQAMYSSGTAHGFLVRDAVEGGGGEEQQFHAREKAPDRPPELVVTFG